MCYDRLKICWEEQRNQKIYMYLATAYLSLQRKLRKRLSDADLLISVVQGRNFYTHRLKLHTYHFFSLRLNRVGQS